MFYENMLINSLIGTDGVLNDSCLTLWQKVVYSFKVLKDFRLSDQLRSLQFRVKRIKVFTMLSHIKFIYADNDILNLFDNNILIRDVKQLEIIENLHSDLAIIRLKYHLESFIDLGIEYSNLDYQEFLIVDFANNN